MSVIGWDIGGAHVKAARVERGRVVAALQIACPLWQGLDRLDAALGEAAPRLGGCALHAVTMTGELADLFAGRAAGVAAILDVVAARLAAPAKVYGARRGWLSAEEAAAHADDVASVNWHATASLLARRHGAALLVDIGSTTADLVPVAGGRPVPRGHSDAERLQSGELVYAGIARSFLMAVAGRVPFRGAWTPLMNEYFASTADVFRILGDLPEEADLHPAADGKEKTVAASQIRLARMIGRDAGEADASEWRRLAGYFAEAQLRAVHDAALLVLSAAALPEAAPVVGAGAGSFVARRLAERLARPFRPFETLIEVEETAAAAASVCAPAAAVALLAEAHFGSR